jgi:type I restriction enzyme, S subunit
VTSGKYRFESGDVLYSKIRPNLNKVTLVDFAGLCSADMYAINVDDRRATPEFIAHLLRGRDFLGYATSLSNRANIPKLNRAQLMRFRFSLPTVDEQRRIAAILDHAGALRAKRRQTLTLLDTLTQSIFHHMFGDLADGRWGRVPLSDLVSKIDNGRSPNCEARPAHEDEWGVLKLGAVTYGVFKPEENKAFLGAVGAMVSNEVNAGDVLFTRKNTYQLVGAVAIVERVRPRLLLPDLIFRLHIDPARVEPRYFQALMMNPRKRPAVRDLSSGSAGSMPNISKARLAGLPIELPPIHQQREFSNRLEYLRVQRCAAEKALAAEDELFACLQSRAFRGEL